jgi:hypothetical protein
MPPRAGHTKSRPHEGTPETRIQLGGIVEIRAFIFPILGILFLAARFVYGPQGLDSLSFLRAVFFLFYVPGNLLLKYSGVENSITGSWLFLIRFTPRSRVVCFG